MSNDFGGKKRSELPDSVFGIPQERKYPMPDEKHTRSAIKLFNHVEPKYEEQLAKAIIKNMKKYNIDGSVVGPNNRLRKYLPKDMIKEKYMLEEYLKSDKGLYHLSKTNLDGKTLYPRIPSNFLVKNGYENGKTERVCFAKSIDGSLRGMSQNLKGVELYVHVPDGQYNIYTPNIKEVPDSKITGEVWIKEPVKLRCIGKIKVIKDKGEDGIPYKYGNNTAELYDWEWRWINTVTNESVSSTVSKDHKQKGYIKLSSLKKIRITESVINKYKKEYPVLRHVRCKDTDEYACDGYMWFKDDNLVCYVGSCQYTDDKTKWIVSLEIVPEYRGYGLSNQILDFCVKSMKCRYLSVGKTNKLAKKIYDKYGFKVYYEDKTMYYMTLDNISKNESYTLNEMYTPQETGISTIIFDIGDVLVSSNFRDCLLQDPEIPNDIVDELINLWVVDKDNIDDTLTLDTYREIVIKRLGPDFSKYITALIRNNVDCVLTFDYTVPLIQDLKNRGYKVYYLSNWSSWTHDLLLQAGKFDFLKLMDGGVFSYDVGCRKPDPEIYEVLLKKYNINPKESIFFDDKEKNIKTANKLGINGVVFYDHDPFIVYKALSKKSAYSESSIMNNSITEYGTTAGTMVGTNHFKVLSTTS